MVSCILDRRIPSSISTVVIGNGPSALALSFLLHGNVPYYNQDGRHPHFDVILDRKLESQRSASLYSSLGRVDNLCEHFEAAGTYSNDAWLVNVLLDTLMWPNADLDLDCQSTVNFIHDPSYARKHIVLGSARAAGGQWAEKAPSRNGDNAKTLSYSEQLSLPGYTFAQYFRETYGEEMAQYERPRRPHVSAYYAAYPERTGLCDALYNETIVTSVSRLDAGGYSIAGTDRSGRPFTTSCENVVLACGLFTHLIEPPPILSRYVGYPATPLRMSNDPILIVGSGFSAADAIVHNLGIRPVIHLYKWDKADYISPLKHCHRSSYPEYADIYRRMKLSANGASSFDDYEGFADCTITQVTEVDGRHDITFVSDDSRETRRTVLVGEIAVLAGRRTSLDFLEPKILRALQIDSHEGWLEKTGLRDQIEARGAALTVDGGKILCIGSITGDSLVKFMFGAVFGAAAKIIGV